MTLPDFLTQQPDGAIFITGHRITLLHVADLYADRQTPEQIADTFPTLALPLIHKIIAFYLENQAEVDAYRTRCHQEIERQAALPRRGPDRVELRRRMEALRRAESA
jgi:uncharacterized protein (DUF433 family)